MLGFRYRAPVGEVISEQIHANAFFTRLSGHGQRSATALLEGTVDGFVDDVVCEPFSLTITLTLLVWWAGGGIPNR